MAYHILRLGGESSMWWFRDPGSFDLRCSPFSGRRFFCCTLCIQLVDRKEGGYRIAEYNFLCVRPRISFHPHFIFHNQSLAILTLRRNFKSVVQSCLVVNNDHTIHILIFIHPCWTSYLLAFHFTCASTTSLQSLGALIHWSYCLLLSLTLFSFLPIEITWSVIMTPCPSSFVPWQNHNPG